MKPANYFPTSQPATPLPHLCNLSGMTDTARAMEAIETLVDIFGPHVQSDEFARFLQDTAGELLYGSLNQTDPQDHGKAH